jgi:ATP-dependent helicase/nuclease subunit A
MLELAYALPRLRIHQVKEWIEDLENACKTGNKGASAVWEPVGGPQRVRDLLRCVAKYGDVHFARFKEDASPSRTTAEAASAIWHEAHHALDAWQKLKDAITVLDYDDLQIMLRDLLHNDSDIRARLRRRFRHVLVDEFQDTSSLQQEIVWLLSGVGEGGRDTARVFLVGDAKQSIYRFRNADVTVYNRTRHEFESAAGCEVRRLSVSFRPNAELMAFFNEAFRRGELLGNEATADYDAWYEPMEAMRQEVPISPAALGLLVASEDEKILYRRAGEARVIARLIRHLLEIRPLVFDHHTNSMRPLHPGHIAILLRATTDVHLYEQQLSEAGIPFYNASGRGFFGQREITDVMNALRVVANPRDSIALVGVLRSPMFSLSDETLFWLGENSRIPWWDRVQEAAGQSAREREPYCFIAADEYSRLVLAARVLSSWREERDRLPLSAIVEKIIEETGYDAAMAGQVGGVRAVANLGKLADLARKFERSGQGGVGAFAEWLTALSASDSEEAQAPTEEEESESVRISSVHGAKGLQWPVVIVADLCRGIGDRAEVSDIRMHPKFGLVPKEPDEVGGQRWRLLGEIIKEQESKEAEAEAKRLLYVAMTRASDLLVLSSSVRLQSGQLKQYGGESWLGRFVSAFNIPTESISAVEHAPQPLESSSPWPWFLVSPTCNEFGSLLQVQMPATATEVSPPGREQAQLFGLEDRAASPIDYSVALRSFPPETSGRRRFAVTEVADYLFCPRFYQLHHVDGLPDALAHEPILSQELSPIERGTVAHRLLQMIGTGGCEELDKLLTSTLPGGGTLRLLPEADQAQLRDLLSWFLSSKFYARHIAAASHLRTEAWISFAHGDALVEGKVDAVAETLEGMVLVDYKTGSGRAVLPDEQEPDMDRFQLALYSYGVRQVLGALPRLGAIVYLADQRIDEIDTQAAADEAARRALEAITRIRGGHFPAARVPEKCRRCRLRWACEETL